MKLEIIFLVLLQFSLVSILTQMNTRFHVCLPNERNKACTREYRPVCALVKKSKDCLKYYPFYTVNSIIEQSLH